MKLSVNKLSEITGQDRRRIKRIAEAGLTPTVEGRSHLYESRDLIPLLYDAAGYDQKLDLTQERAFLARVQRQKAEVELKTMEGEYVPLTDVAEDLQQAMGVFRTRMLAVPAKTAPVLATMDVTAEVFDYLMGIVREALIELSETTEEPYLQELEELKEKHARMEAEVSGAAD